MDKTNFMQKSHLHIAVFEKNLTFIVLLFFMMLLKVVDSFVFLIRYFKYNCGKYKHDSVNIRYTGFKSWASI